MRNICLILALVLGLAQSGSAHAFNGTYYVPESEAKGGEVEPVLAKIESFRRLNIRVVVPAECVSSCTLYTLLLRDGLLCAREGATLAFHQFLRRETRTVNADGTPESYWLNPATPEDLRRTWGAYPSSIKSAVLQRSPSGLPEQGNELYISASDLGIPPC